MPFLNAQDADIIRRRFATDLESDVRLLLFVAASGGLSLPGQEWEIAEFTRQIVTEVAGLSDRLRVEEYSLASHPEIAAQYGVALTPTIVFVGREDFGIRYVGLPSGYEFVTLLELIIAVSRGRGELQAASKEALATLPADAHLQVFVTPT